MRLAAAVATISTVALSCTVFGQRKAEKPPGTHYSAAFLNGGGTVVVFPFEGEAVTFDLPSGFSGYAFSADGKSVYGFARAAEGKMPPVAVASISPPGLTAIEASRSLSDIESLAADADGGIVAVTAVYRHDRVQECGVFELDIARQTAEHVVSNPNRECFNFVSVWNQLSLSPDGSRMVATAGSRRLGVINLKERRVEKVWPGAAAWWSPDGKWIAALTYDSPAGIYLMRASDLSIQRRLGFDTGGRLQWSPDSRYLLVLNLGDCGLGSGYFGSLEMLDIETGRRTTIKSSMCKVNHSSVGWVNDDVLNRR